MAARRPSDRLDDAGLFTVAIAPVAGVFKIATMTTFAAWIYAAGRNLVTAALKGMRVARQPRIPDPPLMSG